MPRSRVPAHISDVKSNGFGLDVQVHRQPLPRQDYSPSGIPTDGGEGHRSTNAEQSAMKPGNKLFRNPIPPGEIGSKEGADMQLPPPQYVDTVAHYRDEEKDPTLHGAAATLRSADKNVAFQEYGPTWQPRRAPMPRARQDDSILGSLATMSADPLMTDNDSSTLFLTREDPRRKDLYGDNRDGMLHNDPAHPGFAAVQKKIEGEGYSSKTAGAILASKTRNASGAAKKNNPRLKKVK